jgi:cytochrome P450
VAEAVLNGLKILRDLPVIQANTPEYLVHIARTYGDVVRFDVPGTTAFLINHPDWIRHILQDNHRNYSKDTFQYNALAQITGRGLLTSDGDTWLRNRRMQQPAFARPRLMTLDEIVAPATQSMLQRWAGIAQANGLVDVDREMMQLTLEIVGKALFSINLEKEAHELTGAVITALDYIVYQSRVMLVPPVWVPTPRNRRFRQAVQRLDTAVEDIIRSREKAGEAGNDLLGMLLQAKDAETGQPLTAKEVRDEVITLLIAGHETVASALTWSWYLLSQNPGARQQLEEEVEKVTAENEPTANDLEALAYTSRVFAEALRLYPPAWIVTRKALGEDHLGETIIPPGATIIISTYAIHRHPAFWEGAERFEPERFTEEQSKNRPRYAYIPFGGGPRLCIGSNFAQVEAQLVLAMVTRRFRLELPETTKVSMEAQVTLRPHGGLWMRPVAR